MRTSEAIQHFGSISALARAIGIKAPSVHEWGEYPPDRRQLQLQALTSGELTAEPGSLDRVIGTPVEAA